MSFTELLLIAVGLSMDAFAVAACAGLTMTRVTVKSSLAVGCYFGVFQAIMPLAGWFLATWFADKIIAFDHWIAFGLLLFIGGRMVIGSLKKEGCPDRECPNETCTDRECPGGERPDAKEFLVKPLTMLPLAVATSIDALAVGVSFAFLRVDIIPASSFIGATAFVLSALGVKTGNVFGPKLKSKAELAGGIILALIGSKILLEHTGIIGL